MPPDNTNSNDWDRESKHVLEGLKDIKYVVEKFRDETRKFAVDAAQLVARLEALDHRTRETRDDLDRMRDEREAYREMMAARLARIETEANQRAGYIAAIVSIIGAVLSVIVSSKFK